MPSTNLLILSRAAWRASRRTHPVDAGELYSTELAGPSEYVEPEGEIEKQHRGREIGEPTDPEEQGPPHDRQHRARECYQVEPHAGHEHRQLGDRSGAILPDVGVRVPDIADEAGCLQRQKQDGDRAVQTGRRAAITK